MFSSYFVLIQQRAIAKWLHNNKSTINKTNSTKATKMLSKRARGRSRGAGRGGGRPLDLPLALFDSFLVALVELVCWSGIDKVLLLPLQYSNSQSTQNNCHTLNRLRRSGVIDNQAIVHWLLCNHSPDMWLHDFCMWPIININSYTLRGHLHNLSGKISFGFMRDNTLEQDMKPSGIRVM